MAKRAATTDLNHTNWDTQNEPEDAGTFTRASKDVLEKRVVKSAVRRLPARDGGTKSAFGTFAGFKTSSAATASPFSFLASANTTSNNPTSLKTNTIASPTSSTNNGTPKSIENGAHKKEDSAGTQTVTSVTASKKTTSDQEDGKASDKSSDYFAKLKGLNESVAQWITQHVNSNPFCFLTPIFRDYEKHLKEIESKHGSETAKATSTTEKVSGTEATKETTSTEKKSDSSPFGALASKLPLASTEWKPDKSIFENIASNTKSIFGKAESPSGSTKSVFGNPDQNVDAQKSIFGNIEQKTGTKSVFGNISTEKNPFFSKPSSTSENKTDDEKPESNTKSISSAFPSSTVTGATFSFGQSSTSNSASAGFSFGSAKPFSLATQAVKPQDSEDKEGEAKDDEDEEPPKPDFKPVTEEGAIYEQRCKVFVKKDGNFSDRGIGTLFLKPTPNGKTQLIVRADTSLGTLLLNTLLTESIPLKRMNKNTIMLVCLVKPESQPPPVPVLLRVKTEEYADQLFEALNKNKK